MTTSVITLEHNPTYMLEIKDATSVQGNVARKISGLFVDGFGNYFQFFSKQKEVLVNAFEHMFTLSVFSVALVDGKIVGIGACTNGEMYSVYPKAKELIKHLGLIKGLIAYFILEHQFHRPPKRVGSRIASVEFIATDSNYRGKGIASALVSSFITRPDYDEFILEVADTNVNAVKLYERLGFKEFLRVKQKNSKQSGVNYLLYMSKTK